MNTRNTPELDELDANAARFTDGDRLLDSKDLAALLGVAPGTIRWMQHEGRTPRSAIVGRRRLYWESDVRAWLDAQFAEQNGENAA